MKIQHIASLLSFTVLATLAAACSGGRDVEARGEIKAPAGVTAQEVLIEFYDVPSEEGAAEKKVDDGERAGRAKKKPTSRPRRTRW